MWIFTDSGFVSAVRPSGDHDNVMVRARDAESLDALAQWPARSSSTAQNGITRIE